MELKDIYYRNAKTWRRTKRQVRKKTTKCAEFQVSTTCLSWVAAVTNSLIKFLAEFCGAFMCVHGRAKGNGESLRTME